MWFRRKRNPSPAEPMSGLREQALTVAAADLGIGPATDRPHVWGVLMETGYPQAVATLVVFADGTTSLYFSNGGGIIGAGAHASVRAAGTQLLAVAERSLAILTPAGATPLPGIGQVRFYVRTFEGTRSAEAAEQALGGGKHALSQLFLAGHAVIAAVRENTPPPK